MPRPDTWVDHLWRAVSILIPAMLVVWQVNRNYRSNLRLQQEQVKRQLALDIYKEFSSAWEVASQAVGNLGNVVRNLNADVNLRANPAYLQFHPVPTHYISDIDQASNNMGQPILRLTGMIEKYELVFHGFDQMRVDTNEQFLKVRGQVSKATSVFLPFAAMNRSVQSRSMIRAALPENLEKLNATCAVWEGDIFELQAFLFDLRVQAQNLLIGPFYGRYISPRKPTDPKLKVLVPDSLKKWWQFGK